MTEKDSKDQQLEWIFQHPSKKDHTLIYKLLQVYFIVMGFIGAITVMFGIMTKFEAPMEMLKLFGIISGFFTIVMVLCYPLTILFIKLMVFFVSIPMKLATIGTEKSKEEKKENKKEKTKDKTSYVSYRFMADHEKLHSWSVVETKGGKHIRYRSVKELIRNKSQNKIEVHTLLGRTYVYATDEDYETVWAFLSARCTDADIYDDDELMNVSKGE